MPPPPPTTGAAQHWDGLVPVGPLGRGFAFTHLSRGGARRGVPQGSPFV